MFDRPLFVAMLITNKMSFFATLSALSFGGGSKTATNKQTRVKIIIIHHWQERKTHNTIALLQGITLRFQFFC